jgi:STE24 endopeptidase
VARILLLLLFLLWMAGTSDMTPRPPDSIGIDLFLFLGIYALLVGVMRVWSVRVARRVASVSFSRSLDRFNFTMFAARCFVPAWFAAAIFLLGWGWIVQEKLGLGSVQTSRLPAVLLGTLPPMLAWMGLWWSQYPAERALREQNVLAQLDEDLPLHEPPRFRAYFVSNFRLQLLFTVVPVLMMIVVRDGINLAVTRHLPGHVQLATGVDADDDPMEMLAWVVSAGLVFLVAPEVLRRVLRTTPLRPGPLRRRLEALCRRSGVRYRDILFWDTDHNMGNAAVMGIIPFMRYILLSDVLIETMTDDQIEAVFAHEVGHVVHRHMAWFVVFFAVLFTALWGVERAAESTRWFGANVLVIGSLILSPAAFCLGFGLLSRRFERQADVYAARSLQKSRSTGETLVESVGRHAASMFTCPAGAMATPNVGLLEGQGFIMGVRTSPEAASSLRDSNSPPPVSDEGAAPRDYNSSMAVDEHLAAGRSYVGPYGAMLFSSALHRVAKVNNIPVAKNEWLHGSIAARMQYLRELSTDPALTGRFDRRMVRIYCGLLFGLVVSAIWLVSAIR